MVEEKTTDLFARVKDELPSDAKVSDIRYEGCEIVIYTKSKDFFLENNGTVKAIVSKLRKRIILRPDPSLCLDMEDTKKKIKKIVPGDAGVKEITFEPAFSRVIIEADKPGLVIGKGGETLREIKKETLWFPVIKRAPAIPSDIVKVLRQVIHEESGWRKDFLDKVGKDIHSGWKETKWIRLSALGGFREVGRSCLLIQTPESKVLLDCGIKPGNNEFPYLEVGEFDINTLNAVILSHAHMDHCGAIPLLYKMGYTGPLYCTLPTRDLMVLLCMDYIQIMQREGGVVPYSTKDIKEAVKHSICIEYDEVSDITPDIRLTLLNSGHILGGSLCHLHVGNGLHNILYTGDIKFDRTALFEPASSNFKRAETVITESTYGSAKDVQPKRIETEQALVDIVNNTMKRGGKILIPSFAVERSQDLMVILKNHGINYPVYLDGMIWDATAIHTTYPEYFGRDLQRQILQKGENPFTDKMFIRIGSSKEREEILKSKDPCIIIATSGMLIAGPSVWWLKKLAEDKNNTLLFVGYQGEGTMGRRIQKGWTEIPMEEEGRTKSVPVNLEVKTITGLSGHSDIKQLINYLSRLKQRPERVIVDHGESSKCVEFAKIVHKTLRTETMAPKNLEVVRLK